MIYGLSALILAAIALVIWLWVRVLRRSAAKTPAIKIPDRGLIGEATTAFEDVTEQFLCDRDVAQPQGPHDGKIDRRG